jgi:hypothetical protein
MDTAGLSAGPFCTPPSAVQAGTAVDTEPEIFTLDTLSLIGILVALSGFGLFVIGLLVRMTGSFKPGLSPLTAAGFGLAFIGILIFVASIALKIAE